MQQTKLDSFIEACINTTVGFVVQFIAAAIFLSFLGVPISATQNFILGIGMTFVSVARGYAIRRFSQRYLATLKEKIKQFFRKEVK